MPFFLLDVKQNVFDIYCPEETCLQKVLKKFRKLVFLVHEENFFHWCWYICTLPVQRNNLNEFLKKSSFFNRKKRKFSFLKISKIYIWYDRRPTFFLYLQLTEIYVFRENFRSNFSRKAQKHLIVLLRKKTLINRVITALYVLEKSFGRLLQKNQNFGFSVEHWLKDFSLTSKILNLIDQKKLFAESLGTFRENSNFFER